MILRKILLALVAMFFFNNSAVASSVNILDLTNQNVAATNLAPVTPNPFAYREVTILGLTEPTNVQYTIDMDASEAPPFLYTLYGGFRLIFPGSQNLTVEAPLSSSEEGVFTGVVSATLVDVPADGLYARVQMFRDGGNFIETISSTMVRIQIERLPDPDLSIVPLPAAGWMLVAGIIGLAAFSRRRTPQAVV